MSKRVKISLAVFLIAGLGGLGWLVLPSREPLYQGRSLSIWLDSYNQYLSAHVLGDGTSQDQQHQEAAEAAIRQFGTNALPILLKMLQAKDSAFKSNAMILLKKQSFIRLHLHSDIEQHNMALSGFQALGPIARPAVPALIGLLNDPELRYVAALSLGKIGPAAQNAAPSLIAWLDESEGALRYCAADALGGIGPVAQEAVSALLRHLSDTNPFVQDAVALALGKLHAHSEIVVPMVMQRIQAELQAGGFSPSKFKALGAFGAQAKSAVPMLSGLLEHRNSYAQRAAAETLKQIDSDSIEPRLHPTAEK